MIGRKYRATRLIENGTFGSVYMGRNVETNETVSIKIEKIAHSGYSQMLIVEAKILNYLKDVDNIPKLKWFGQEKNIHMLVMTYLGRSIESLLFSHYPFQPDYVFKLGIKLLTILQHIHDRHIIHRDIKLANILLSADNNIYDIYLIDFGMACIWDPVVPVEPSSSVIGSPLFMSIRAHHRQPLSKRDDFESMVYVLICVALKKIPWNNKTLYGDQIAQLKQSMIYNEELPKVLRNMLAYTYQLDYLDTPDYDDWILQLLCE